ncbi:hypothetical protein D3C81_2145200 [compost metagenome]
MQTRPFRARTVEMLPDPPIGILRLPHVEFPILELKHVQVTGAAFQLPIHGVLPVRFQELSGDF